MRTSEGCGKNFLWPEKKARNDIKELVPSDVFERCCMLVDVTAKRAILPLALVLFGELLGEQVIIYVWGFG